MKIGEKKEMICINCPIGCSLTAEKTEEGFKITGNTCPRGEKYAVAELTHPTRTLTTTVAVANRDGVYLPVKTKAPISKEKLFDAMAVLSKVKVNAPIESGSVIVSAVCGESDVIATGSVK